MPLPGKPDGMGLSHVRGGTSISAGPSAGTSGAVKRGSWAINGDGSVADALDSIGPTDLEQAAVSARPTASTGSRNGAALSMSSTRGVREPADGWFRVTLRAVNPLCNASAAILQPHPQSGPHPPARRATDARQLRHARHDRYAALPSTTASASQRCATGVMLHRRDRVPGRRDTQAAQRRRPTPACTRIAAPPNRLRSIHRLFRAR